MFYVQIFVCSAFNKLLPGDSTVKITRQPLFFWDSQRAAYKTGGRGHCLRLMFAYQHCWSLAIYVFHLI